MITWLPYLQSDCRLLQCHAVYYALENNLNWLVKKVFNFSITFGCLSFHLAMSASEGGGGGQIPSEGGSSLYKEEALSRSIGPWMMVEFHNFVILALEIWPVCVTAIWRSSKRCVRQTNYSRGNVMSFAVVFMLTKWLQSVWVYVLKLSNNCWREKKGMRISLKGGLNLWILPSNSCSWLQANCKHLRVIQTPRGSRLAAWLVFQAIFRHSSVEHLSGNIFVSVFIYQVKRKSMCTSEVLTH